jgi:hypothetical protein
MLQGDRDQSYYQTSPYMVRALALHGLCASAEGSRGEAERAEGTCKCWRLRGEAASASVPSEVPGATSEGADLREADKPR